MQVFYQLGGWLGVGSILVILTVTVIWILVARHNNKPQPPRDTVHMNEKAKAVFDLLNQSYEQGKDVKGVLPGGQGLRVMAVPLKKGAKKTLLALGFETYDANPIKRNRMDDEKEYPIRNANHEGEPVLNESMHNRLYSYAEYVEQILSGPKKY